MSRASLGIVAGLFLLGCIVAIVPAQESSRRTASKYRPSTEPAERPNLSPLEPDLPPVVPAPGRSLPSALRSGFVPSSQSPENDATESASSTITSAKQPATEPNELSDLNDGGLRSVLKRPRALPPAASATAVPTDPAPTADSAPQAPAVSVPSAAAANPPSSFSSELARRLGESAKSAPSRPASAVSSSATAAPRVASKSAALKVELAGPPGITVGKPAAYVVTVSNESDTAADEVHLRIPLPHSVTIQTTQPTSGEASVQRDAGGADRLLWVVPRVAARSREQLKVQLITREADGFDLTAEWTVKPAVAKAAIVVKQPQLALSLAGPAEMTFGEEKTFTLTVSNPGSGDAERVVVTVAAANAPPQQFEAGVIPAGHKKDVPLAVVASQPGSIDLQISASGDGGLEARTAGKVVVRKAEIAVAIDGPPMKYAGSEAVYVVTVANSGTAAADNVNLSLMLPAGAKYVGGIDGGAAAGTTVKWKITSLPAGGERQFEARLQLTSPGSNRVAVESQAAASGVTKCSAATEVEAVADLKLVVHDPSGPLPTEEPTTYELQVLNRGTQAAKNVKILVQFSDGIEPVSFDGCEARIVPGQVVCQPLPNLGPGEQTTIRVRAKAHDPGTHHFRVEVTSTEGDARLVSEGTTRFFVNSARPGAAATTAKRPNLLPTPTAPTTIR